MYRMKTALWKESDSDEKQREETINEGFYGEETPIDCVNALVYEIRGDKSPWELAYAVDADKLDETEADTIFGDVLKTQKMLEEIDNE